MKLAASYNYFNGDEHIIASLRTIRPCVEAISMVWQKTSNAGEAIAPTAMAALEKAKSTGLVDHVVEYTPDFSLSRKENESNKRRLGLSIARSTRFTEYVLLSLDFSKTILSARPI